jgi:hypothetical protein
MWLPILNTQQLKPSGFPMHRWYFQQNRSYLANLLLHDVSAPGDEGGAYRTEIRAAGCLSDGAKFIGYWEPETPVVATESNTYASVYQLPKHLTLVLVNATRREKVVNFKIDPDKVKTLLGTDVFAFQDVDKACIPPIDKEYEELKSGTVKMKTFEAGLPSTEESDEVLQGMADNLVREIDAVEKKANDPDGFFEYHNFRYENGILRLKIQGDDYRLLTITPGG